jgi:AcrR family transcriptional regulator
VSAGGGSGALPASTGDEPVGSGKAGTTTDGDAVGQLAQSVDGRAARAQRTRQAIVDAAVALLAAGDLKPTADRIAERAGVSVRALWLHFPDMEALFAAIAAEVLARQDHRFRPVDPRLDLATRIRRFCRQRATLLDAIAPFARASQLREPFSAVLRTYHGRHVQRVADEVRVLFAVEIQGAGEPSAREDLVAALTAAATWGAWSVLRDDLGLGRRRAESVLARSMAALLAQPARPAQPAARAGHRSPAATSPHRDPATTRTGKEPR